MLNTKEFIRRAKIVHGNRYDYSRVNYTGVNDKVEIICKDHGSFFQSIRLHVERRNGCLQCAKLLPKREYITGKEFFRRAKKIHKDKYDYTNSIFTRYDSMIDITCPRHGVFTLKAQLHITNKNGCPKCAVRCDTTHFTEKSEKLYGKYYSYKFARYETIDTPLIIVCPKHGEQIISPSDHYRVGCWFCKRNRSQDIWLDEIGIPNTKQNRQVRLIVNEKLFVVDGFKNNTIYLYHGDYWHGNPELYKAEDINKRSGKTFGELHQSTLLYEDTLRQAGYNVVSIWEYDWQQGKRF